MSIIQTIVTALATGAVAALPSLAGTAISDGYQSLKQWIIAKYATVDLDLLEKQPASKSRQGVVEEELTAAQADKDAHLIQLAQRMLDVIASQAPAAAQTIGIDLADIRAGSLKLSDILAQGSGAVTGAKIKGATIAGALEISGVRAVQTPPTSATQRAAKPIKILFLAANPSDSTRLRIDEEARAIDQALRQAESRNITILSHWAVRIDDLQELLLRHQPDIVHFSGHGSADDQIILQDASGASAPVPTHALRSLFRILKDNVRCVVLNACYSQHQAEAIAEVIDCVIGMSDAISDEAARRFASAFYSGLGYARSLQTAFDLGSNLIELNNLPEADKPQLIAPRLDPATLYLIDPKV